MEFSRPEHWSGCSLSLLQGIFLTQGSNPGLPHCTRILYQLSHKGSPYNGKEFKKEYVCITESLWGALDTNTTL